MLGEKKKKEKKNIRDLSIFFAVQNFFVAMLKIL